MSEQTGKNRKLFLTLRCQLPNIEGNKELGNHQLASIIVKPDPGTRGWWRNDTELPRILQWDTSPLEGGKGTFTVQTSGGCTFNQTVNNNGTNHHHLPLDMVCPGGHGIASGAFPAQFLNWSTRKQQTHSNERTFCKISVLCSSQTAGSWQVKGDCEMVQIRETEEAGQRNLVWIPDPILDLKIYFAIKNNTEITGKICILSVS